MTPSRILCPVDFSDASTHAVQLAIQVAEYYKSRIAGLHVVTPFDLAAAGAQTSSEEAAEANRLRSLLRDQFADAERHGIAIDVLVEAGQPTRLILERSVDLQVDLIVMGTHGTSGFQHLVLGSVTEKVLRKAQCPVLTVPPRAQSTARLPFKRLVCAVDFSNASIEAVQTAVSLCEQSRAGLTLIHVLEWPWQEPPAPPWEQLPIEQRSALFEFRCYVEESARNRLASLIPHTAPAPQVTICVRSGKPYEQILQKAAEDGADLIVVGVSSRHTLDVSLFGSTTNQIVRRAVCPVLTLRSVARDS